MTVQANPHKVNLRRMANDDVDDALSALTKEEIGELVELIDPDVR